MIIAVVLVTGSGTDSTDPSGSGEYEIVVDGVSNAVNPSSASTISIPGGAIYSMTATGSISNGPGSGQWYSACVYHQLPTSPSEMVLDVAYTDGTVCEIDLTSVSSGVDVPFTAMIFDTGAGDNSGEIVITLAQ